MKLESKRNCYTKFNNIEQKMEQFWNSCYHFINEGVTIFQKFIILLKFNVFYLYKKYYFDKTKWL